MFSFFSFQLYFRNGRPPLITLYIPCYKVLALEHVEKLCLNVRNNVFVFFKVVRYVSSVGVNRCKMDHFCASWQNVCWHNMENICCTKLKIQLQRLTKLIFMWSKAQNDLTNSWWLSRVQKINSANCNQFLTFLPPKLCNSCPNDLKFSEKVFLVELNKQCKTHDHWNIFGQVTMF